jgi:excisionase family DNA binding protein
MSTSGPSSQSTSGTPSGSSPASSPELDLASLVGDWLAWSEAADALGVPVSKVRTMIRDHQLAAAVPVPGEGQRIPALLLDEGQGGGQVVKGVPGMLTLLHDAGFSDDEALRWMFTADPTLPGRPIDALRENRGSEAKRRAQALAF